MKLWIAIRSLLHWRPLLVLVLGLWVATHWFWRVVDIDEYWTGCEVLKPEIARRTSLEVKAILATTLAVMIVVRRHATTT